MKHPDKNPGATEDPPEWKEYRTNIEMIIFTPERGAFRNKKIQRKLDFVNLLRPLLFKYIIFSFVYYKC